MFDRTGIHRKIIAEDARSCIRRDAETMKVLLFM